MKVQKQPPEVFHEKAVPKNFTMFTGKYLYCSLFLIEFQAFRSATLLKRDSKTDEYSCEYCEIFKNTYFE